MLWGAQAFHLPGAWWPFSAWLNADFGEEMNVNRREIEAHPLSKVAGDGSGKRMCRTNLVPFSSRP